MKSAHRQQFLERSRDPETVTEFPPPIVHNMPSYHVDKNHKYDEEEL